MKKVMMVGQTYSGKTTLCQALYGRERGYRKTQAIEVLQAAIDTPGEYLENQQYWKALLVTSVEAEVILLVQACTDGQTWFPPGFAAMFGGRAVWGVVNKIDLGTPALIAKTEELLLMAGAERLYRTNALGGQGVDELLAALEEEA